MSPSNEEMQNLHDHEKIVSRLDMMGKEISEGFKVMHADLKNVLVQTNEKYDTLKDELHARELSEAKLEGRLDLVEKTTRDNEGLWKKVIYTCIGSITLAALAGLSKLSGIW